MLRLDVPALFETMTGSSQPIICRCLFFIASMYFVKTILWRHDTGDPTFAKYKTMPMDDISIPIEHLYGRHSKFVHSVIPLSPHLNETFQMDFTESQVKDTVTLVTAYFNLGSFQKGESGHHNYHASNFERWMQVFSRISNPLVIYAEEDGVLNYFKHLRRQHANLTKLVKIGRKQLWSFSLLEKTKTLFKSGLYPKHHPNTVIPEYPCVVHTKYEVAFLTAKNNPFKTKYIAWLDIGYFRDLLKSRSLNPITLYKPPGFNDSLVAFNQVYKPPKEWPTPKDILLHKYDWVGTGFFLATAPVMVQWARQYMLFTECYLSQNLMNSDQQIIYAMFANNNICPITPTVFLQAYYSGAEGEWFYLGNIAADEGMKH